MQSTSTFSFGFRLNYACTVLLFLRVPVQMCTLHAPNGKCILAFLMLRVTRWLSFEEVFNGQSGCVCIGRMRTHCCIYYGRLRLPSNSSWHVYLVASLAATQPKDFYELFAFLWNATMSQHHNLAKSCVVSNSNEYFSFHSVVKTKFIFNIFHVFTRIWLKWTWDRLGICIFMDFLFQFPSFQAAIRFSFFSMNKSDEVYDKIYFIDGI